MVHAPAYAALITLLLIALSIRVIQVRTRLKVSLGDASDASLQRAIRAQANCVEYAPLGVLLLVILEMQGTPGWAIHVLGVGLLAGRLLHAVAISQIQEPLKLRVVGMAMTFTTLALQSLAILVMLVL